ncbi:hypothetical protein DE146DRAFT_613855 [Phaeosphaeria sp. MPI-PUGE-AT-0046c]|nr:hypothetical protein DE146DRAFT_613855 [Phaeosphaeria sp. MPI-PUGE-AT-0046c]
MSATRIQKFTPPQEPGRPDKTQPPTRAPASQKRKRPVAAAGRDNANLGPASRRKIQKKETLSPANATKQYGIFQHNDLLDTTGADAELIHTAPNFTAAHTRLLAHASSLISSNAAWGATSTRTLHNTFEVLGYDNDIRARFDIDTVRSTANGDWARERMWLATHYADRPHEHYGMYVETNCADAAHRNQFIVGGFESLGEASSAMKISAQGYLAANLGARLLERSVEIMDAEGVVVQRYLIAKGRQIDGKFVSEEEWVKKEIALRGGDEEFLAALARDEAKSKGILRLPTPDSGTGVVEETSNPRVTEVASTPVPVQEQAQHQPAPEVKPQQQPAQEIEQQRTPAQEWCTCRQPDLGELMIGCDNDGCPVQWYHGHCLGLEQAPEGDWLCPACAPEDTASSVAASNKHEGARSKGKAKEKEGKATKTKTKAKAKVAAKGKGAKGKKKL